MENKKQTRLETLLEQIELLNEMIKSNKKDSDLISTASIKKQTAIVNKWINKVLEC